MVSKRQVKRAWCVRLLVMRNLRYSPDCWRSRVEPLRAPPKIQRTQPPYTSSQHVMNQWQARQDNPFGKIPRRTSCHPGHAICKDSRIDATASIRLGLSAFFRASHVDGPRKSNHGAVNAVKPGNDALARSHFPSEAHNVVSRRDRGRPTDKRRLSRRIVVEVDPEAAC